MGNFEDNLTFEDVINQTLENPDFLIELAMKLKEEKERKS